MLVLSRKVGEQIVIGDGIVVTINRIANNRVAVGISAPADVRVVRSELTADVSTPRPQCDHDAAGALTSCAG